MIESTGDRRTLPCTVWAQLIQRGRHSPQDTVFDRRLWRFADSHWRMGMGGWIPMDNTLQLDKESVLIGCCQWDSKTPVGKAGCGQFCTAV